MFAFDYYFLRLTLLQLKGVGEFRSARLNEGQLGGDDMVQGLRDKWGFSHGVFRSQPLGCNKDPRPGTPKGEIHLVL